VFLLHSNIVPNNDPMSDSPEAPTRLTSHAVFAEQVRTTFLELVKEGRADLRQSSAFGPIFIKGKEAAANG